MTHARLADKLLYNDWLRNNHYFDDLAVFSIGTLHPGGLKASKKVMNEFDWNGKKVLDIGIGNGFTIKYLSQIGAECHGIEKSEYMTRSAILNGVDYRIIFNADINVFPFTSTYDFIIFEGV